MTLKKLVHPKIGFYFLNGKKLSQQPQRGPIRGCKTYLYANQQLSSIKFNVNNFSTGKKTKLFLFPIKINNF